MFARHSEKLVAVAVGLLAISAIVVLARYLNGSRYAEPVPFIRTLAATPYVEHFTVAKASMQATAQDAAQVAATSAHPALALVRPGSQLIRTASISLKVRSVAQALHAVESVATMQMGDIISLNDETPASSTAPHTATMEIRVPVNRFDSTLAQLGRLGNVESQSVAAQDVSDQIVDSAARLRNLRHTEQDMLAIMDRSGSIDQVLNVEEQLSDVRDQIERLDAQLARVKDQVAYSTIDITLRQPPSAVVSSKLSVLKDAWKAAIASLRDFTLALASAGLWLIAFSPYLIVAALGCLLAYRRLRKSYSGS